jgi:hypothetical protein
MFFPAADTIAFSTAGTEDVRIDSSGNVGIGTSSPSTYGDLAVYRAKTGTATVAVNQQNAATNDGAKFATYYQGTETASLRYYWDGSQFQGQLYSYGTLAFLNGATPTERARIASDGKFTLATETLYITNIPTTSTAGNCLISSGEGNKFYRSTSSLKYKRNVVDMQRGVQDVMQLRPVNFNGVSDFDGDKLFAGFIAEEVESLGFKEFVIYDDKGDPDGLQYANMVALLTKAIQEQQALITSLTARIAALEGAAQ